MPKAKPRTSFEDEKHHTQVSYLSTSYESVVL